MKEQTLNSIVKECITSALLELMQERPLSDITITELVKKAGVGRITFYRNFDSKEDVIVKHLKKLTAQWRQKYDRNPTEDIVCSFFRYLYSIRDLLGLLYKSDLWYIIDRCFKVVQGPRLEQSNIDAYRNAILSGLLASWCEEWFKRGMQETPEELADFFHRLYIHEITLLS